MSKEATKARYLTMLQAARRIGDESRMPGDPTVRRALAAHGLLEHDDDGQCIVLCSVVEDMRRNYQASGYLFPRRQKGVTK
jgi:hypothetical protein